MSRSDTMGSMNIYEAAIYYGCQINHIQKFIARGLLHTPFDKREIDELRRRNLHKQINSRSNPRRRRR